MRSACHGKIYQLSPLAIVSDSGLSAPICDRLTNTWLDSANGRAVARAPKWRSLALQVD
jgi:hypothetical protein